MTDLVIILVYLAMMLIWIFKKIKFRSLVFSTTIRIIIIKFIYSLILPFSVFVYIFFPPENAVRFLLGASSIGALGGLFWLLDRERRIVIIKSVDHETLKKYKDLFKSGNEERKRFLLDVFFHVFRFLDLSFTTLEKA